MNKIFFVIVILGIAFLATTGVLIVFNAKGEAPSVSARDASSRGEIVGAVETSSAGYSPQTDDQASVEVEIIPVKLGTKESANVFAVSFNTHSVSLDYDFAKISVLKDDLGNFYSAVRWNGESGGHHLSGELVFPKIDAGAKSVQLEINGVGGVKRTFSWNLK
jgi:hypothetical protein